MHGIVMHTIHVAGYVFTGVPAMVPNARIDDSTVNGSNLIITLLQ